MERTPYLVRLGNRGISARYLVSWWDGATEPRPRDLAPGDIRIEVAGGLSGTVWDLMGEEASAFRALVIPMARSVVDPDLPASLKDAPEGDRPCEYGRAHPGRAHDPSGGAGLPPPGRGDHPKQGGIPGVNDPVRDDDTESGGVHTA